MRGMTEQSCCKDKKIFQKNFHQVYKGFNDDIWDDIFGRNEPDPCCTPMPTCRDKSYGNGSSLQPPKNVARPCCTCNCNGQNDTNNSAMGPSNQCPSGSGSQTQKDSSCCKTKNSFKPAQVYVGFNESVFGGYGGCQ
ncbi:unnamed protein product [Allacma fusca]|uniref:Uncharacterized protein n=1 Tax=Allacma fusca TaxID=39272 RepID=A0A8J2JJD5_9HEXA|nr:unnamed protein product [Allacma fusca]